MNWSTVHVYFLRGGAKNYSELSCYNFDLRLIYGTSMTLPVRTHGHFASLWIKLTTNHVITSGNETTRLLPTANKDYKVERKKKRKSE